MDLGHKQTDAMLKDMEGRIKKVYTQAARETQAKTLRYFSAYADKYNGKVSELNAGKITKDEFRQWCRTNIMTGKRWQEMNDTIATDLANADKLAISMVNGYTPEVYALNHNYGTYEVEKKTLVNTSYTLYDRQTVERLIKNDPKLIPTPKLDENKDIRWNKQRFSNGIVQGILQGESVRDIAHRVALGTSSSDYKAAIRNARTATTGAENAGRIDSYERAEKMGIKVKKVWMATLDDRTRDSHALLDGEERDYDEPFSNGLMFPGDPDGDDPSEIWNCRCTLVANVDGTPAYDMSDTAWRDNKLEGQTYDEWKDAHREQEEQPEDNGSGNNGYKVFANGDDANNYFGKHPERSLRRTDRAEYDRQMALYESSMYKRWSDKLSGDQTSSIGAYSGDAYSGINGLLRHQMTENMVTQWNMTERITIQDMIGNIESAINGFELESPIRVYRTCENDVLENLNLKVGTMFHDDGFGSTSILKEKVASGNIVMEIDVPAGKGYGAWINPLSGAEDEEYEFLLQRGSDYKVKSIRYEGGDTIVSLDLTGNTQTEWSYATKEEVIEQWKKKGIYDEYNAGRI